jgi:hypothetical protein
LVHAKNFFKTSYISKSETAIYNYDKSFQAKKELLIDIRFIISETQTEVLILGTIQDA